MDVKTESLFLMHSKNTPQQQGQTLAQGKGLEKIFQENGPKKQAGVAILISDDLNSNTI